jgi:hypothetical protein
MTWCGQLFLNVPRSNIIVGVAKVAGAAAKLKAATSGLPHNHSMRCQREIPAKSTCYWPF